MSDPIKIFIGVDSREPVTFSVLVQSILTRASRPVAIIPLTRRSIHREYTRPRGPTEATEFSLTRFLVPYLSGYRGLSIFMDCDMLCRVDIGDVLIHPLADPGRAVYCCQHEYIPKALLKFDGHEQTKYPRKNWSSFMIFDGARCQALTPELVNHAPGVDLHRFRWIPDDQIGSLPLEWNHLVGEYDPRPDAKIIHFTNGAPCFPGYEQCEYAGEWWREYLSMVTPASAPALVTTL
jgi:hypothetical protein